MGIEVYSRSPSSDDLLEETQPNEDVNSLKKNIKFSISLGKSTAVHPLHLVPGKRNCTGSVAIFQVIPAKIFPTLQAVVPKARKQPMAMMPCGW